MTKIALCAESFGYGPVSKAAALGKLLKKRFPKVEIHIVADSVAYEFFKREGFVASKTFNYFNSEERNLVEKKITKTMDAAIVALDPRWASLFNKSIPTFFLDSLGFMWPKNFFNNYPGLKTLKKYFVQNVFDSEKKLQGFGISSIHSVGAMTLLPFYSVDKLYKKYEFIIQLGGLVNIFSSKSGAEYAKYVCQLLKPIINESLSSSILLTSNSVLNNSQSLHGFPAASIENYQAVSAYSNAKYIFTSPGLTTLLELAFLRSFVVPLPPQNFSQSIIIRNIVRKYKDLPSIWYFLERKFLIEEGIDEETGCKLVEEKLKSIYESSSFAEDYRILALECMQGESIIPYDIIHSYQGISECAQSIGSILNL